MSITHNVRFLPSKMNKTMLSSTNMIDINHICRHFSCCVSRLKFEQVGHDQAFVASAPVEEAVAEPDPDDKKLD